MSSSGRDVRSRPGGQRLFSPEDEKCRSLLLLGSLGGNLLDEPALDLERPKIILRHPLGAERSSGPFLDAAPIGFSRGIIGVNDKVVQSGRPHRGVGFLATPENVSNRISRSPSGRFGKRVQSRAGDLTIRLWRGELRRWPRCCRETPLTAGGGIRATPSRRILAKCEPGASARRSLNPRADSGRGFSDRRPRHQKRRPSRV